MSDERALSLYVSLSVLPILAWCHMASNFGFLAAVICLHVCTSFQQDTF